jgi:hypothetical protein
MAAVFAAVAAAFTPMAAAAVNSWPTYHLDQSRNANDTTDPGLSSVGPAPRWTGAVDGAVYAEPLVVGTQVLVATENDSVYSFDAASGAQNWMRHLGTPAPQSALPCGNIFPLGITGTPVVDTSTGTMYLIAEVYNAGVVSHRLYGLNINNGGATMINVSADPPGSPSDFPVAAEQQRAALALSGTRVYWTYGGLAGDCGGFHGWVLGANRSDGGAQISRDVTAAGAEGGIWAPSGIATDANGDLYVTTGNGTTNVNTPDYSDSVVRLNQGLTILGHFLPANWVAENQADQDLGSHGPLLLNGNLIYQVGKAGQAFLIDRTAMPLAPGTTNGGMVYQASLGCAGFGGSAYDATADIIYSACNSGVVALQVQRSGCAAAAAACFHVLWHGPSDATAPPILAGGKLWVRNNTFDQGGTAKLYALNLSNGTVAQTLTNGISHAVHFGTPSAAGGQLYIAGDHTVVAFGNSCVGPGGYQLDGWGGIHPFCGAPAVTMQQAYWPGWDIARGIAQRADHRSGYVLDGYGGVHEFAAGVTSPAHWADSSHAYWSGWDIARGIVIDPCDSSGESGYVLDGWGGIHEFGTNGANRPPHFADTSHAYWPGWDIARGIVMNPCTGGAGSEGGYILDGWGGIHSFGTATPIADSSHAYWPGWDIANGIVSTGTGGGYTLDGWGGVHRFGTETHNIIDSSHAYWPGWDIARGLVSSGAGQGYILDGYGGIHGFGGAPSPTGGGYWPGWDIARGLSH